MVVLAKLKYLLLLPFLAMFLWAVSWGVADYLSYQVVTKEGKWLEDNKVSTIKEWNNAKSLLDLAIFLNPFNPNYPEVMGRLYVWRLYVMNAPVASYEEQKEYVDISKNSLRVAIEARPTWPLTWALLLETKSVDNQIDDEYWFLWDKSLELGPWDRATLAKLLTSGLYHWERGVFNESQQKKVMDVFVRMLTKYTTERDAINIAGPAGALPFFCQRLPASVVTKRLEDICTALRENALRNASEPPVNPEGRGN